MTLEGNMPSHMRLDGLRSGLDGDGIEDLITSDLMTPRGLALA